MPRKLIQKLVITASIAVAVIGLALFVYFHALGRTVPLWDDVALSYGLVFVFVLLLDLFSKGAARARGEAEGSRRRPTPVPSVQPLQRPVGPGQRDLPEGSVRLVRIGQNQQSRFAAMLEEAVAEVLALDEVRLAEDKTGQSASTIAAHWLQDENVYPFFVAYHDAVVGCCVLTIFDKQPILEFLYIESGARRQRLATYALHRLTEFIRLLGGDAKLYAVVSKSNARGQRFLSMNEFSLFGGIGEGNSPAQNSPRYFPYLPLPLQQVWWTKTID